MLIRLRIFETPLFRELQEKKQVSRTPLTETLRKHWREVLLAAGVRLTENYCFYLVSLYILSYGKDYLGVPRWMLLRIVSVAAVLEVFAMPLYGYLSDYWSRRAVYSFGCLFLIGFAVPYYLLLHTRDPLWIGVGTVVALVGGHAVLYSVQASLIPELFGTRVRYTGASIGYQLAAPIAGGLAPMLAETLAEKYPGQFWLLAQVVILMSVASLICVQLLAETSRKDISGAE
jgi:MHS family shikimate/dehydroshikimate transporter-like MFS transporter